MAKKKKPARDKNPAAVLMGNLSHASRAARLTPEQLSEANRKAANARWHPEGKK
jgi:hypothetical protein